MTEQTETQGMEYWQGYAAGYGAGLATANSSVQAMGTLGESTSESYDAGFADGFTAATGAEWRIGSTWK